MREPFLTWNEKIAPQNKAATSRAKAQWDGVAKPLDGLGKLETAVIRIAGLTGDENVSIDRRTVLVLCADNGIVKEGVTQTDASVTATMARRIFEHRSSVCLMAKTTRAEVIPVDFGMLTRVPGVRDMHVASGTQNMAEGPAMTEAQAFRAIENGILLAKERKAAGDRILVTGEMGIGNTSTSSAIAAVLLNLPVEIVTGRGAGLSDAGLLRKRDAIKRAIEVNKPDPSDPFDVLRKLGGFDIAGLVGLYIGAAIERIPILIDGLPSSVAALVASRLVPNSKTAMLASHCSKEPVAQAILDELGLSAILFADMKLGEGTGAVCMLPLLDMALAVYHGSASFSDAGVEQYTPQGGKPC
ncbi:MAG: nicotinate-nucleotide--dimethylbenzimidazole phosphoribosyltransferase [Clostridia bacterium]|nr:nicotinate-nucleotide--dimethylbenzimidazole phosphoribosyltransferase [Clostridia bacterium]